MLDIDEIKINKNNILLSFFTLFFLFLYLFISLFIHWRSLTTIFITSNRGGGDIKQRHQIQYVL